MFAKIKAWIKASGLGNLAWAGLCIVSLLFIKGTFGAFLGGVGAGLFIYLNYDVIKNLLKGDK